MNALMVQKKKYKTELIRVFFVNSYYPFEVREEYIDNKQYDFSFSKNLSTRSVYQDKIKAKIKSLQMLKEFYKKSFKTSTPKRVKLYKVAKELDALVEKYPEKII